MLGTDPENMPDHVWDELKNRALALIEKLEMGDSSSIHTAIEDLNAARDRNIYVEVGKLTRGLHDAIVNFDIDTNSPVGGGAESGEHTSKMTNAQDRLDYVLSLTQTSADKTMDMVEEGIPIAGEIHERAQALKVDWGRLQRREMEPDEFRDLYRRMDEFLVFSGDSSNLLSEKLNTILLAQDFQDLTGQVIKKVISLVQEVEVRLVELMRVAGQVEELTGIVRNADEQPAPAKEPVSAVEAEGPQIRTDSPDVVTGQDDVDDLLSSLGF
ncbi:MAG: chemotaxis protein CheZ [Oceanicoccus sp.]|jgi:chemotaxis protein CheZ